MAGGLPIRLEERSVGEIASLVLESNWAIQNLEYSPQVLEQKQCRY